MTREHRLIDAESGRIVGKLLATQGVEAMRGVLDSSLAPDKA